MDQHILSKYIHKMQIKKFSLLCFYSVIQMKILSWFATHRINKMNMVMYFMLLDELNLL